MVSTEQCDIHYSADMRAQVRLWNEGDIPFHARMTELVHQHGALAACELVHNGSYSPNHIGPGRFLFHQSTRRSRVHILCTQGLWISGTLPVFDNGTGEQHVWPSKPGLISFMSMQGTTSPCCWSFYRQGSIHVAMSMVVVLKTGSDCSGVY
ncbi:MAG: hypothetical protein CM1200mP18_11530 [Gammaproteobacteria bacterium]|nr:MAG: hypothetical protein CM1200mP18_11530 [Gammaproteobacteria bacterium]